MQNDDSTKRYKKEDILYYFQEIKSEMQKDGLERIGLFGSLARGETDQFSDIDIAIKLRDDYLESRSVWSYFELIEKIKSLISKKFHRKCDIFDLNSDSFIKKDILMVSLKF